MKMKMATSTKIVLGIVLIGAMYMGGYEKNYKDAYEYLLIGVIILLVWYNERRK